MAGPATYLCILPMRQHLLTAHSRWSGSGGVDYPVYLNIINFPLNNLNYLLEGPGWHLEGAREGDEDDSKISSREHDAHDR